MVECEVLGTITLRLVVALLLLTAPALGSAVPLPTQSCAPPPYSPPLAPCPGSSASSSSLEMSMTGRFC